MRDRTGARKGRLGRLAKQSAIYALGNLALKVGGLLLLPLYLDPDYLSQADYGRLGLIETATQLLVVFGGLGLVTGLLKYATDPAYADDRDTFVFTTLAATAGAAGLVALGVWALAPPLAAWMLDDAGRSTVIVLAGAYAGLKAIGAVPYMVLRVQERAGLFVAAFVLEFALFVGGIWYALAVRGAGLEGVLVAFVVSAGAAAALLGGATLVRTRWRFSLRFADLLLRFGLPLTFSGFATVLLNTGDRFILEAISGPEAVAVYVLAAKFGSVVYMLFVQSFNMAFSVSGLKASADEGSGLHVRIFRPYAALAGWGVLAVSLLALDATVLLSDNPAYREAEDLILPIAFGFMVYGAYFIVVNLLYAAKRTGVIARSVLLAALLNAALNVALIPFIGALGAALATLAAYGALAGVTIWEATRREPVPFPLGAFGVVALVVVGLWALGQPSLGWPQPQRLALRIGLVAAYPLALLGAGVYTAKEAATGWAAMRGFFGREGTEHGREHGP